MRSGVPAPQDSEATRADSGNSRDPREQGRGPAARPPPRRQRLRELGPGGALRPSPALEEASPELDFLVGRDLEMEGRLQEALEAYTRALSKDPESVYLLKRAAELSARQNRLSEAVVYAERALELEPDNQGVRLFLGTLYRFRKDVASAERVLRDESGQPLNDDAAVLLYGIYADNRRLGDARSSRRVDDRRQSGWAARLLRPRRCPREAR